jgi:hypothetical protein
VPGVVQFPFAPSKLVGKVFDELNVFCKVSVTLYENTVAFDAGRFSVVQNGLGALPQPLPKI